MSTVKSGKRFRVVFRVRRCRAEPCRRMIHMKELRRRPLEPVPVRHALMPQRQLAPRLRVQLGGGVRRDDPVEMRSCRHGPQDDP